MVVSVNFKELPPDLQKQMTCAHHWECDDPRLPVSKCHCLKCHATKEFANRISQEQAELLEGVSRQEDPMDGKTMKERGEQLAPARAEAEILMRAGRTPAEVQNALSRAYGHIPLGTIAGWKGRMKPLVAPGPALPPPGLPPASPQAPGAQAVAQDDPGAATDKAPAGAALDPAGQPARLPDQQHPLLQALLQMLPVDKGRHHLWMAAWRAAYELLYASVTVGGETYLP